MRATLKILTQPAGTTDEVGANFVITPDEARFELDTPIELKARTCYILVPCGEDGTELGEYREEAQPLPVDRVLTAITFRNRRSVA